MVRQESKALNGIITVLICLILAVSVILLIVAVVGEPSREQPGGTAEPGMHEPEEEDSFDPNKIVVREDPTVMTVDLLPVKNSVFQYFCYISAGEVLNGATNPKDIVINGIDGVAFKTIIFNMAKDYAAKYALYKQAYESDNYAINETYALYLRSNFMHASDREELDEMNADLLYQHGVVRNEYIDILLCNDAIAAYRSVLAEEANYEYAELKAFYEEKETLFREKAVRVIVLQNTQEAIATQLKEKIENGYDMTTLVAEYSVSATKGSDNGLWEGKAESFESKSIQAFLKTAAVGDIAVLSEENVIYVVRCENDGSFEQQKEAVSAYKAVYDFDMQLMKKIKENEVSVTVEEGLMERLELPAFINEFLGESETTES